MRRYVKIATESPSELSRREGYNSCRRKRVLKVSSNEERIRLDEQCARTSCQKPRYRRKFSNASRNAGESVRSYSSILAIGRTMGDTSSADNNVGTVPSGGCTMMILRGSCEYEAPRLLSENKGVCVFTQQPSLSQDHSKESILLIHLHPLPIQ